MKTTEQKYRYTVQAWSNVDGWQNTGFGGHSQSDAQFAADALMRNLDKWMNRTPTKVRVIDNQEGDK